MRPSGLPLVFLEGITDGFSEERILGTGGYGRVYKGVDKNGREIAVKKLHHMPGLDDVQFNNELNNLMKVRHQNIIRLVGYCSETRDILVEHDGKLVLCMNIDRVLCLEYLQGGSLDNHLNDESCGHDWPTRYKIIKGICEGLSYLHGDSVEKSIFHLDLKPANILLDKNMIPKIADFGLSRLFGETHTHTTKQCIGTLAYMPPEYLKYQKISEKYDVYSLGVIIIEIMTGEGGYTKQADMSSQEFIEHVHRNWRERIESTPSYASPDKDCQQVKRCIELALKCVEADRKRRPTVEDITRELKQIETNGSASPCDQARLAKIGQWGGVGGGSCDIEVAPHRLRSLTIGSDEVIYSLEFSYDDHDGRQHIAGPWGGLGPKGHGNTPRRIDLGPSEFLTEVHGTIGPCDFAPGGVIRSLTIITTAGKKYGPFGEVKGTPFQIPVVRNNGNVVGFFARAGWCIDAFGIYVKPKQETEESGLVKIGPWGGERGQVHDINVAPKRLKSVTICSGAVINSLAFTYRDRVGQQHTAGPWGSSGGTSAHTDTIQLGTSEVLTGVRGTTGPVVTSLTLVTSTRSYGPFGEGGGTPFQIPMRGKGSIVGFFGRAESSYVNAIGVYANPNQEAMEEEARLAKIGQWGGVGGGSCDIEVAPRRLRSLTIGSDEVIYSLEFSYDDHDGRQHTAGPWGAQGPKGHGNTPRRINLGPSEFLTEVHGTIGPCDFTPGGVIRSLTIITTAGRYGPFGEVKGTPFQIPVVRSNGNVVGFFARAGWCIDAFGIYVKPKQETEESGLVKIGPWGGKGGQVHDIKVAPKRLKSVTISRGAVINSLAFTYRDRDGQQHTAGPWGGSGGTSARTDTIQLGTSEFLTGVSGTTGPFVPASASVVTSLTLVTNARSYGPFGEGGGTPFQIPMWGKGRIVGFFGRAESSYVNAIGVYANPNQEAMEEELVCSREPGLTKIGPWGADGDDGNVRDIDVETGPHRLQSVTISYGAIINSLSFSYINFKGLPYTVGPWGTPGEKSYKIVLDPLELLQGVSGTVGSSGGASPSNAVTSLTLETNHCRAYGPFGQRGGGGGTPFSAAAETDGCIVGFFGRAGSCLQALGVYVHRY